MKNTKENTAYIVVILILLYCMSSMTVYWFKHPELTKMQLYMEHLFDALLWR